jgi:hypothetical protein
VFAQELDHGSTAGVEMDEEIRKSAPLYRVKREILVYAGR